MPSQQNSFQRQNLHSPLGGAHRFNEGNNLLEKEAFSGVTAEKRTTREHRSKTLIEETVLTRPFGGTRVSVTVSMGVTAHISHIGTFLRSSYISSIIYVLSGDKTDPIKMILK